jgi:tetratricopeptide (TPR) repeat protein
LRSIADVSRRLGDDDRRSEALVDLLALGPDDDGLLAELQVLKDGAGEAKTAANLCLRRAGITTDLRARRERLLEAARLFEKAGANADAVSVYERIAESTPDDPEALPKLRHMYTESGSWDRLETLLTRALGAVSGTRARDLAVELTQIVRRRDVKSAVAVLASLKPGTAGDEEVDSLFDALLAEVGAFSDLVAFLERRSRAVRDRGGNGLPFDRRRAELLETKIGDDVAALEAYENILGEAPSDVATLDAFVRMSRKRVDWPRLSRGLSAQAKVAQPDAQSALYLELAEVESRLERPEAVEAALLAARATAPDAHEPERRLRHFYESSAQWKKLGGLLNDFARHREARGDGMAAKALLSDAAEAYERCGDHPTAMTALERASNLDPEDKDLLLRLANAYGETGRNKEAAVMLQRLIDAYGTRRTKELAVYNHRLGRVLVGLGDRQKALGCYDLAFKIDPGSVETLRDLGILAFEVGELDKAQKAFRALLLQKLDQAGITKAEVFCYLGEISARQGDKPKAQNLLDRALENDPHLERARKLLDEVKRSG